MPETMLNSAAVGEDEEVVVSEPSTTEPQTKQDPQTPDSEEEQEQDSPEDLQTAVAALKDQIAQQQKRLDDTVAATKERQAEFTKISQKLAATEAQRDVYKEQMVQPNTADTQRQDEQWKEFVESVNDEPAKLANWTKNAFHEMDDRTRQMIEYMLEQRLGPIAQQVTAFDPERQAVKDAIDALSKEEWFQNMDPAAQLKAAKSFKAQMPSNNRPKAPPPQGGPGTSVGKTAKPRSKPEDAFPEGYLASIGLADTGEQKSMLLGGNP